MYDKYSKYFNNVINYDLIFSNQDLIFEYYLGVKPNTKVRLLSPFRNSDTTPGCRFDFHKDGKWYFVDNATYKGRLYFDCIALVSNIENITYLQAANYIIDNVPLDKEISYDNIQMNDDFIPIIKFTRIKEYEGYFQNILDIPVSYMDSQYCFRVDNYWCNTKANRSIRLNPLGNPKEEEIYAYYFDKTGKVKLYFPNRDKHKFYTNCNHEDLFGYKTEFDYTKPLIITKSGKDCMFLNYHYGYNVIGIPSETIKHLSSSLLSFCSLFSKIIVWLDNDYTGIKYSNILTNLLKIEFPDKEIINNIHGEHLAKDPTDMHLNNQLKNYITYDFNRKIITSI